MKKRMILLSKVALVYHPAYLTHTLRNHVENKERLLHILDVLAEHGLTDKFPTLQPFAATTDELAYVHDRDYIDSVRDACASGERLLDVDTYILPHSFDVAKLAAGGALLGVREILSGSPDQAFVLCRPPGHHAERNRAMGFCLFNNIAIAAEAARREFGLKKVAIIDWDLHHGNGTQNTFFSDPEVLFISVHESPAYPGTGHYLDFGRGRGEGYNINIPLPEGQGDADYAHCFEKVVVPVLTAYEPELLLVSAGQDAYFADPLGGMRLTPKGFSAMTRSLLDVAKRTARGRMLFCLEGGYHLSGQAECVTKVLATLLEAGSTGTDLEETRYEPPTEATRATVERVIAVQAKYWPVLRGQRP